MYGFIALIYKKLIWLKCLSFNENSITKMTEAETEWLQSQSSMNWCSQSNLNSFTGMKAQTRARSLCQRANDLKIKSSNWIGEEPSDLFKLPNTERPWLALIGFRDPAQPNYHSCCMAVLLNWNLFSRLCAEQTGNKQIYRELCQVKGYA